MLQSFLQNMGYNPGAIDGMWGPRTKAAWDAFSTRNNVTSLDQNVWDHVEAGDLGGFEQGQWTNSAVADDNNWQATVGYGGENGGADPSLEDTALNQEEIDNIRATYPSLAYLLDHEEIGPLIREAVREQWDFTMLSARVEQTDWFKETSESQRLWDASVERDPATIDQRITQQEIVVDNLFSAYGITLTKGELEDISINILRNGLTSEQQLRLVGDYARKAAKGDDGALSGSLGGNLGATVQSLRTQAGDYYLSYSEDEFEEMAIRIMEGRWTMEGALNQMANQAAELYPHLKDRLAEGMTLKDYYRPVKNKLGQLLNMSPNDIDLNDSRWAPVTQMMDDGQGNYRTMNFTELNRFARQQDEWWDTDQAASEGYGMANTLLRTMGII